MLDKARTVQSRIDLDQESERDLRKWWRSYASENQRGSAKLWRIGVPFKRAVKECDEAAEDSVMEPRTWMRSRSSIMTRIGRHCSTKRGVPGLFARLSG